MKFRITTKLNGKAEATELVVDTEYVGILPHRIRPSSCTLLKRMDEGYRNFILD